MLFVLKQVLLVSTLGKILETVWRIIMHTNGRVYTCIVLRISCYSYLFKKATDSKCNRPEVCQVRSNFKFTDICQMYRLACLNH